MYWQQTKLLPQFFIPEFELLGKKELLHNIFPKFDACHLQLINLTFFNAFLIQSKVCLIIGKVLGLFRLKVEIKGKISFFLVLLHFLIRFWVFLKVCLNLIL